MNLNLVMGLIVRHKEIHELVSVCTNNYSEHLFVIALISACFLNFLNFHSPFHSFREMVFSPASLLYSSGYLSPRDCKASSNSPPLLRGSSLWTGGSDWTALYESTRYIGRISTITSNFKTDLYSTLFAKPH